MINIHVLLTKTDSLEYSVEATIPMEALPKDIRKRLIRATGQRTIPTIFDALTTLNWEETGLIGQCVPSYRGAKVSCGYTVDIVKSGLQKYVRRGKVRSAINMSVLLDSMVFHGPDSKPHYTNYVHRLMIIYLEDIGIANVGLWPIIDRYIDVMWEGAPGCTPEHRGRAMKKAIKIPMLLAQSQHSRALCWIHKACKVDELPVRDVVHHLYPDITIYDDIKTNRKPKKIVKVDEDTRTQRAVDNLVSALEHQLPLVSMYWAYTLTTYGNSHSKYYGRIKPGYLVLYVLERYMKEHTPELLTYHALALKWYKEIHTKEAFLCYAMLIGMLTIKDVPLTPYQKVDNTLDYRGQYLIIAGGYVPPIAEYIMDMHTAKGRREHMGRLEFVTDGAHVEPEMYFAGMEVYRQIYVNVGLIQDYGLHAWQQCINMVPYPILNPHVLTISADGTEVYGDGTKVQCNVCNTYLDMEHQIEQWMKHHPEHRDRLYVTQQVFKDMSHEGQYRCHTCMT